MARINLTTTGWSPGKVVAWSGFAASAMLLGSLFNAIATSTLDAPPPRSPQPLAVTEEHDAPCYMVITPSPYPEPNPCEP